MYCTKCGAKLPRDARFCMNCGKPVAAIASEKAAASTASLGKAVAPAVVPAKVAEPKGTSSSSQNNPSPEQSETLRGAVNATKHRSRRRVPMVVLVALAMALAVGTAYAAYRVYTDVWLPAQQAQNEQAVEAPGEITYSVETRSMDVSVPVDPYDAPGKREAQKWYYPHIEASTQSDAVDKINAALEESMRTDVEKTNAAPDTAKDMGGAIVFICQYRSITLTYIDNDIVCVRDQRYDTGWGPHGSTTVTGCAYSLETGDPIDPVSAFGLTPEQAKSAVADAVTAYLATDPSDLLSTNAVVRDITNMCLMSPALGSGVDVENPLDGCSHFYIANEGLVFATEDHQMGSYAYGRREILVAPSDGSLAKVGDTVAIEAPMGFSGSGQIPSQ